MIQSFRKHRLAFITLVYWFLLIYIVAALVWWFISLENQNAQMFAYKLEQLNRSDTSFQNNLRQIDIERQRKTTQYIGEGVTFLLVILIGAVFVYRATKKQILLSQQEQNFMMAVTHELKTPIAVTKLNLETLQKYKHELDEQKQQKLITNTLQEADRLNVLTNNILAAAQLESPNYRISKQQVNLSNLVNDSIKDFRNRFHHRMIEAAISNNIFVMGETMLLQMLVNNLLENAFKYSPENGVVKVDLKKEHGKAIFKIADEGEGIPDQEKKKYLRNFIGPAMRRRGTQKARGLDCIFANELYMIIKAISGFMTTFQRELFFKWTCKRYNYGQR